MQKTLYIRDIASVADRIDRALIEYIKEGQIETFEGFRHFDILAFDWYDIYDVEAEPEKILIYLDADDVFFLCENELSYRKAVSVFHTADTNERAMYDFLQGLIRGDTKHLEQLEDTIVGLEDAVITREEECVHEIVNLRRELLRLKKYYEQLQSIADELCENDNGLLSEESLRWFSIWESRVERLLRAVLNLRDYLTQVREAYQAQIDIRQNELMKFFTVVTSIFLPLSLIVGWYGMNFSNMPELRWKFGYPVIIGLCALIVAGEIVLFKKKRWF
ncbi:MAG: CorA family divalent cation transporter [Clostridiaceae bacterium]|nr:magnesium transporter [Clostridiales bacterium]MDD6878105.1 CorA family divalent cation transporter [Clostridiaceae bacterium]MDY3072878.1 CorA family divalent cation transporter [Eubacteriales bacterium]MDY3285458.1 CorA family divalent cation transporter [Eubacteriales bacterium]MDY5015163.1 CorA family divalent cation transporter [Eubacteriales bacterium]